MSVGAGCYVTGVLADGHHACSWREILRDGRSRSRASSSAGVDWGLGPSHFVTDFHRACVMARRVPQGAEGDGAGREMGPVSSQDGPRGGFWRLFLETCLFHHLREHKDIKVTHMCWCTYNTSLCVSGVDCVLCAWSKVAAGLDTRCDPMREFVATVMK